MTTSDYLQSLKNDMATLKTNVAEKGVEVDENDNFTTLAQKVADISGGGGNIDEYIDMNYTSSSANVPIKSAGTWSNMIKKLDVSNVSAFAYQYFLGFRGTDIVGLGDADFKTSASSGEGLSDMFSGCTNLVNLDLDKFKTYGRDMNNMFNLCTSIKKIDFSNYNSNVMKACAMIFNGCTSLVTVNIGTFDFSKVTGQSGFRANGMFNNCTNLENLTFGINFGKGFTVSTNNTYGSLILNTCNKLTHESLMDVINKLYDLSGNGKNKQNLFLGATNIAKLTEEEIAIATNKGWNVG